MSKRLGRPTARDTRGPELSTPGAIRQAATELFARDGYAATSVRQIARAAGVDAALVIRHFGSKEALFVETIPEHGPFDPVFDGPLETFGQRIVTFILDGVDHNQLNVFLDVLRSSSSDAIRERTADMMDASFSKLKDQLGGPDALLRTRLVAAQVAGLLMAVAGSAQALSPRDRRAVARIYGAAIQSTIESPRQTRRGSA